MEAIILAGGFGSRLSEETGLKPKPMIEIGNLPILVHIINYLNSFGINKFVICLGYKGDYIKEYFFKKLYTNGNIEINMNTKEIKPLDEKKEKYTKIINNIFIGDLYTFNDWYSVLKNEEK